MEQSKGNALVSLRTRVEFSGHEMAVINVRGCDMFIARQIALGFEYARPDALTDKISSDWSDELAEGTDYLVLRNGELAAVKAAAPDLVDPRAPSLMLLTESGVHLVALLSRQPAAKRLRRWLADEVLPQLRRTGTYAVPSAMSPAPTRRRGPRATLHARSAEVLSTGIDDLQRDGQLTVGTATALQALVRQVTRGPLALPAPKTTNEQIEERITAVLGPEPADYHEGVYWRAAHSTLFYAAKAEVLRAAGTIEAPLWLTQRRNGLIAWLNWNIRMGRITQEQQARLLDAIELAIIATIGPMPGKP